MTNKPMLSVDLLPCPHCGSSARLTTYSGAPAIFCGNGQCEAIMGGEEYMGTGEHLIESWNQRAPAAAQHQGEPVAELQVAFFEHGSMARINWFTPSAFEPGATKLYAEQPAPVIRCSFCDVTDNAGNPWSGHHESIDGKLIYRVMGCKDHKHLVEALDGSKTAPVAVVMPERQIVPDNLMAGLTRKWCEGWNDALEEVARLNGVKP